MRAIGTPGHRASDQIMQRFAASQLGIPERETEVTPEPEVKTASTKKTATSNCPQCGGAMSAKGNMERCACGYAQATAQAKTASSTPKKASETSVAEYYKKIYPDDYVSELTGTPDSGCGGDKVEYGNVSIDKPVGDVGVKASMRVRASDIETAGDCEVPDAHPEPKSEKPNGKADEAGNAKVQSGDSANSVGGPNDIPKGEKPNGSANEAGDVKVPDLGVPSKAATRRRAMTACQKCGSNLDANAQCPTCNSGAEAAQDSGATASKFISREVIAKFCPECADEMAKAGVKAVRATVIAKAIAERAAKARK